MNMRHKQKSLALSHTVLKGGIAMTTAEIQEFIEEMEAIGDVWEEADVERVYGNLTLEDAVADRKSSVGMLFDIFGKVIQKNG